MNTELHHIGSRNLVVCLDGTGNAYGSANTNVVKIYAMLDHDPHQQIAYYDPGVGTFSAQGAWTRASKWLTRVMGLAFGYGLATTLAESYGFLQRNYRPGDRVYIFGFSRGAYAARALAGMVHKVGLLRPELRDLVPYAVDIFKKENRSSVIHGFRDTFSRPCPVHFLGLWDTVSSVGWVWNPKVLPYTRDNPSVAIVRHAVSIDERRAFYRTNLWNDSAADQDVRQTWFPGVHSDIGGSYPEHEAGLAQLALQWMACHAQSAGLLVDPVAQQRLLPRTTHADGPVAPDPLAPIHRSLHGIWWLAEILPKWFRDPRRNFRRRLRFNLARRRFMPAGSWVHPAVVQRQASAQANYRPTNLPADVRVDMSEQLLCPGNVDTRIAATAPLPSSP
ncbi:T6SS phospholipase effector Tle1-like catalytic domain-containing protein [Lysobacter sp. GCM10012299]|uniref:T6SS phospholipase effector Tle1-like catalytic domain-containing protein n=1 Tax=Lysobacter sp. GCM10012299 TaxID=3317333 RepID=UPI003623BED7